MSTGFWIECDECGKRQETSCTHWYTLDLGTLTLTYEGLHNQSSQSHGLGTKHLCSLDCLELLSRRLVQLAKDRL